ncbi:unnamed protein product [Mycena citricolor]|uniref:Transcriptional repressor Tup1 N-terminal domain-containing protein n=1 Tax=Mycena citricolor TaxID=2018698 RepID=A0AAD2H4L3_9AGAR|nr:unnamed protein product [Mycena citricolor]CAK5269167.1 unnamed protein product [Mycena citricolor]
MAALRAGVPNLVSGATGAALITEALDVVKAEFDHLTSEVALVRREREDCEATLTAQVNELNIIRQSLYELETQHSKVRAKYEQELARLREELHMLRHGHQPPPQSSLAYHHHSHRPPLHPSSSTQSITDRHPERERDRERGTSTNVIVSERSDRDAREPNVKRTKTTERVGRPGPAPVTPIEVHRLSPHPSSTLSFLDADLASFPSHLKKESAATASSPGRPEWFAIWNPAVKQKKIGDVSLLHTLLHESVVCCVRFSKDGRFLATGCNRTAQVFDARTGTKVCSLMDPSVPKGGDLYIRSVCFSPDGALLATGAEDAQIRIWDIVKKRIIAVLSGHQQEIYALDFSTDGRFVVSGSGDKTVRIWDMRTVLPANPQQTVSCTVLNITDSAPPPSTARSSPGPTPDGGVTSVAISANGSRVAAGSLDALVRVWDVKSGALVRRLRGHGDSVYSVAFVPEGTVSSAKGIGLISGGLDRTVKGWDLGLGPSPQGWKEDGRPSSRSSSVLKGWKEGTGEVSEGRCTTTFIGHKDYVLSVAVSHDGEWIVSGSKDRGVQFWDAKTGVVQCMLQGHKNSVISIDLSPAGNVLATGSGDWHARIWSYDVVS